MHNVKSDKLWAPLYPAEKFALYPDDNEIPSKISRRDMTQFKFVFQKCDSTWLYLQKLRGRTGDGGASQELFGGILTGMLDACGLAVQGCGERRLLSVAV